MRYYATTLPHDGCIMLLDDVVTGHDAAILMLLMLLLPL